MLDTIREPEAAIFTPELRRAIRLADTLSLDFKDSRVTIRLTRERKRRDPFDDGQHTIVFPDFKARIAPGKRDKTYWPTGERTADYSREPSNVFDPDRGCWSISSLQYCPVVLTAFACVPIGAELEFRVLLDSMSNGYCAGAQLHGDLLMMFARRGKLNRQFILDTSVVAHNSARFGFMG